MDKFILEGRQYYITPLLQSHVTSTYVNWLNDEETTRFLEARHQRWDQMNLEAYVQSFESCDSKYLFGIFTRDSHLHIGNTAITDVNRFHGTFTFGVLIGDKAYWGKQAAREACILAVQFGFEQLNLRKAFGGAYSNQLASRMVLRNLGFSEEARIKEKYRFGEKLVDHIIYTMTDAQFRDHKPNFF